MAPIKIGIVGLGKIAQDQHVPTLRSKAEFELMGAASLQNQLGDLPTFNALESLAEATPDLSAVAICTPPQVRYAIARDALERGLHVLLEKPPGITVGEVQALAHVAERCRVTLFAAWHSRFAPAVASARAWIADRRISQVTVSWKEDVRVWHPGQKWIWTSGGLGVFDPGINALSILTHILPGDLAMNEADLTFPSNCATPIAAKLTLTGPNGAPVSVELDFLQQGVQTWDILVECGHESLKLSLGGKYLSIDGVPIEVGETQEYDALYSHFATLIAARRCDVDVAPLQLVADAFLSGRRIEAAAFIE